MILRDSRVLTDLGPSRLRASPRQELRLMTVLARQRLGFALVWLLIRRIREDRETAYLEDMGYDDCPICVANRQREAWT